MRTAPTLMAVALFAAAASAQTVQYLEKDGLVAMEAEKPTRSTGGWAQEKDDSASNGAYMKGERRRSKSSKLEYKIHFRQAGWYRLWLRGQCTSDKDNDCYVWLDGEKASVPDGDTWREVAGLKLDSKSWGWESVAKTEAHTPRSLRAKGTWVNVKTPGLHTLQLGSRSRDFKIDKAVLQIENKVKRPGGEGPAETVLRGAGELLPQRTVYEERDGAVVIEAELFTRNDGYTVRTDNGPGGKARNWSGPGWIFSDSRAAKRLEYEIHFTKTGAYYVHLRALAGYNPDWTRNVEGHDNGFHAAFDGKKISGPGIYVKKPKSWVWYSRFQTGSDDAAIQITVDQPGKHTFAIIRREELSRLDKIVIHDGQYGTDSAGKLKGKGPDATFRQTARRKVARKSYSSKRTKPKADPLARFEPKLKSIRIAAREGRYDEAMGKIKALQEEAGGDDAAKSALSRILHAVEAARRLRAKVIQGAAKGKREQVYLAVVGRVQRVRIVGADEKALTVQVMGSEMPMPWSRLDAKGFASVASKYIDESSGADYLALARYCAGNGLPKQATTFAERAVQLSPDLRKKAAAVSSR